MIFLCFPISFIVSISDKRSANSFSVASAEKEYTFLWSYVFYVDDIESKAWSSERRESEKREKKEKKTASTRSRLHLHTNSLADVQNKEGAQKRMPTVFVSRKKLLFNFDVIIEF